MSDQGACLSLRMVALTSFLIESSPKTKLCAFDNCHTCTFKRILIIFDSRNRVPYAGMFFFFVPVCVIAPKRILNEPLHSITLITFKAF